jgi:hypothetical protein
MNLKTFNQSLKRAWQVMKWKVIFAAALAFVLVMAPMGASGQFGLDPCCAIISAGLSTISGLLQNVVAKPLGQIQQIQQQAANFQQQVIYPTSAINNARGLAGQMLGQLRQMTQPAVHGAGQPDLREGLWNRDGSGGRSAANSRSC